jgi:hypothetical protein
MLHGGVGFGAIWFMTTLTEPNNVGNLRASLQTKIIAATRAGDLGGAERGGVQTGPGASGFGACPNFGWRLASQLVSHIGCEAPRNGLT